MCIKDINPASDHHYLIIPKSHIPNAKDLKPDDEPLCKKFSFFFSFLKIVISFFNVTNILVFIC